LREIGGEFDGVRGVSHDREVPSGVDDFLKRRNLSSASLQGEGLLQVDAVDFFLDLSRVIAWVVNECMQPAVIGVSKHPALRKG